MSNQPFDLSKLDYETTRHQKRRKLLVWSVAPVIVVFIVSLWFLLPTILTRQAIIAYKGENYNTARGWLTPLTWSSPEPFVIAFNSGTVDAQKGKYDRSEAELSRAVAIAPSQQKKCMAAQNLVTTLSKHAESLKKEEPKQADSIATKATTVIKENTKCFKGAAASGGGASQSNSQSPSPSKSQQEQLEQKEQEGRERKAKFAREEEYNPDNPSIKPW